VDAQASGQLHCLRIQQQVLFNLRLAASEMDSLAGGDIWPNSDHAPPTFTLTPPLSRLELRYGALDAVNEVQYVC
jgi:hypothetical protein